MSFLKYLLLILIIPHPVYASDIIINCRSQQCSPVESKFNENLKIVPGQVVNQSVIINNYRSDRCYLSLDTKNQTPKSNLSTQLNLKIIKHQITYFDGSLSSFFSIHPLFLGSTNPKKTETYEFYLSLPPRTNNRFQNQTTIFNLNFSFTCHSPPSPHFWHYLKKFFSFLGN